MRWSFTDLSDCRVNWYENIGGDPVGWVAHENVTVNANGAEAVETGHINGGCSGRVCDLLDVAWKTRCDDDDDDDGVSAARRLHFHGLARSVVMVPGGGWVGQSS